jgi:hypothetical protein
LNNCLRELRVLLLKKKKKKPVGNIIVQKKKRESFFYWMTKRVFTWNIETRERDGGGCDDILSQTAQKDKKHI